MVWIKKLMYMTIFVPGKVNILNYIMAWLEINRYICHQLIFQWVISSVIIKPCMISVNPFQAKLTSI